MATDDLPNAGLNRGDEADGIVEVGGEVIYQVKEVEGRVERELGLAVWRPCDLNQL